MSNGTLFLTEKDFADVVDSEGDVVGSAPKHWSETDLDPGLTLKTRSRRSSSSSTPAGSGSGTSKPEERKSGEEPAGNAGAEEWTAYAREKGATDADLLDGDGKPLGRDALRKKYGTPAS